MNINIFCEVMPYSSVDRYEQFYYENEESTLLRIVDIEVLAVISIFNIVFYLKYMDINADEVFGL
jgi:hypothetical protein